MHRAVIPHRVAWAVPALATLLLLPLPPLSPASAVTCTQTDPIELRYCQLGGASSFLRAPTSASYAIASGRTRDYVGGSLFWSATSGTHYVRGAILAKYRALRGPLSVLGFPSTDELPTPDAVGRFNHFARGGSIYWTPSTGAHEVHGAIRAKWAQLGWERSVLGYPTTDEYGVPTGRRSNFQHGTLTYVVATGQTVVAADPHEYWLTEPLTSAAAVQRAFDNFHTAYWSGADSATPVRLPDGRNALTFGDTFRGSRTSTGAFAPNPYMVSNSLVTYDAQRLRSLPGPNPGGAFIPDDSDGAFYWPCGGVSVGGRLWLVSARSYRSSAGLGWRASNPRLAAFDVPIGGDPVYRGTVPMPGSAFDAAGNQIGIAWNAAVTIEGGTVYFFGTRPQPGAFGAAMFLAEAPATSLSTPTTWRYWTPSGWSTDAAQAAPLINAGPGGVPGGFGVTKTATGYVITGKVNAFLSGGISQWSAPSVTGPWSQNADILPSFPPPLAAGDWSYGGFLIPALSMSSGRMLLAYSRNNWYWDQLMANANYYMPQFAEVTPATGGGLRAPAPPQLAPVPVPPGVNPLGPTPRGLRGQRR